MRVRRSGLFLLLCSGILGNTAPVFAQAERDIKLVLQVTVDGLRFDLLNRYRENFSKDGFNYLLDNGSVYSNAHYQHANTETIVGHTGINGVNLAVSTSNFPSYKGHPLIKQVKRNHHITRSGHIYVIKDPYWFLLEEGLVAVMHGSPWRYDTHVPIIFAGPGIKPNSVQRQVHPVDVAPTIAAYLGMSPPASARGTPLMEVCAAGCP